MTDAHFSVIAERWQGRFAGPLLTLAHDDYRPARSIWNGMIDRMPGLIARCTSREDVAQAVRLARAEGLSVSVRGGGHSVAGTAVCSDGIMIDLSPMKAITVDVAKRTATAQTGLTWGEFDPVTQEHGLATTGGLISTTGIGGL